MGGLHLAGFAPRAAQVKLVLQRKKAVDDDRVHRLLNNKAGDVVRRVHHAVALALAIDILLAGCSKVGCQGKARHIAGAGNALQVADALLKNAAQHRHTDFLRVVVTRQLGKTGHQRVADREAVECRIRRKQAAVIGRDFQVRVAGVHRFEQTDKIGP